MRSIRPLHITGLLLLLVSLLLFGLSGCSGRAADQSGTDGAALGTTEEGHGEVENEHDHDEEGGSDLDLPVEELFAAACEHGVATHQCDECRYEVGVAKVEDALLEGGLIRVGQVEERSLGTVIRLTGEIRFDERRIAHLGPRTHGVVQEVFVDLGQPVHPGEILVALESVDLAEAEATYLEALAKNRRAERDHQRKSDLREAKIASERDFLETEQIAEASRIGLRLAEQTLLRLGKTAEEVETLGAAGPSGAKGRLQIRSPFGGEILEMHAVRGELVEPDEDILLVGDTERLWVWVDLYEEHLALLDRQSRKGAVPASIGVRAYPHERFRGTIDFIGRAMDHATRTVKARVELENREGKLRPGMFAEVFLTLDAETVGRVVPSSAILEDEGRSFVFVHHDQSYYVRRPVLLGRTDGETTEILAGLEPGQRIVVDGAFLLKSDVLRSKMGAGCAD